MPASEVGNYCRDVAGMARSYEIFLLNCGQWAL